ncbi:MAG: hypothetical protein ABIB71_04340 [Candidatus Woesearchaeota archaeon]
MKCPECKNKMKEIAVNIQDADTKVKSYQCSKCGFFDFEKKSMNKAIKEIKLKEQPLTIKQKVIKLSHNRIGMYFNKDVARCLNLKGGEDIYISVPDQNHIVLNLGKVPSGRICRDAPKKKQS